MTLDKKSIILYSCILAFIILIIIIYKYRATIFGSGVINQGEPIQYTPGTSSYTSDSFPLHKGSGGDNVKNLQTAINKMKGALGITLTVDGKFGPLTEAAVAKVLNGTKVVSLDDYNKYFKGVLIATNGSTTLSIGDSVKVKSAALAGCNLNDSNYQFVRNAKAGEYLGVIQIIGTGSSYQIMTASGQRYWVAMSCVEKI